jgi:hypothetical protein
VNARHVPFILTDRLIREDIPFLLARIEVLERAHAELQSGALSVVEHVKRGYAHDGDHAEGAGIEWCYRCFVCAALSSPSSIKEDVK